jgi:hypothetical protein
MVAGNRDRGGGDIECPNPGADVWYEVADDRARENDQASPLWTVVLTAEAPDNTVCAPPWINV